MEKIDMHIHTNLSDGDLKIEEIIKKAKENNCFKIAITDHEIIKDYKKISMNNNIDIINGCEFNTSEKGMHILGYGILDLDYIKYNIDNLHKENEEVSFKLIDKLIHLGFDISSDKIKQQLLLEGIEYDYLDKRHIVKYLINKGYTKSVGDTYKYLIGRGTDLYLPLKKISSKMIIDMIHKSGGTAVLAHPSTLCLNEKELLEKVKELVLYGLEGIEVFNPVMDDKDLIISKKISKELNIIQTLGSDFHNGNEIGIECNELVYENIVEKIKTNNRRFYNGKNK